MKKRLMAASAALLMIFFCACGANQDVPKEALEIVKEELLQIEEAGSSFSIKYIGKTINAYVVLPGTSEEMSSAMMGNENAVKKWSKLISETNDFCFEIKDRLRSSGYDDIDVVMSIMDENNTDLLMVQSKNGTLYYDVVSGIDLR